MQTEVENANPTILNASQLPTRQKKTQKKPAIGPETKFDYIVNAKPSYLPSSWPDDDVESEPRYTEEPIDEQEIYDLISTIQDPEHPVSLGQLSVVRLEDIHLSPPPSAGPVEPAELVEVRVDVTPTISHCSLATVIGLGVRVRLESALPPNYRVDVRVKKDTHSQDDQVNKQLADKERVAAALENETLRSVLDKMLETCA